MRLKDIKVGSWYHCTAGVGQVVSVGTRFRGLVEVNIVGPLPLGQRVLKPREILGETEPYRPGELPK